MFNLMFWTLLLGGLWLVKKVVELALENEYASWAPALARLWVRGAGFICRSQRERWWADLQYVQRVERNSGLTPAASCLVSAPFLALRDTARAARNWKRSTSRTAVLDPNVLVLSGRIEALGLSHATLSVLRAHRVATVDQLLSMREEELLRMRNFARAALDEVKEKIVEGGFIQPS